MIEPQFSEVDYDPFASELARVVPTTEAQREVWLADQLGREASLSYNESVSLLFTGQLALDAMQQALQALSDRHESLRSTISADGLSLMIAAHGSLMARVVDLSAMSKSQKADTIGAARRMEVNHPFDLEQGPLIRATLFEFGPEHHELIITAHHIVCDGWSFGILTGDLMALYARFAQGGDSGEPLLPDSFGDYALAQHETAYQAQADADTQWWVRQYDGSLPVLELPTDRPRQPFRSFDSLREELVLEATLVDGLRKLGQKNGASLFVTMFGMFSGLIARLAGQDDVVVGVPAAGQASEGRSALIGHCVQLLPIRLACDIEQSVPELLKLTRSRVLDAYEHQACTFGQLLKKLQVERNPGRLPLVSVLFNLDQAIRSEDLSVAGLKVEFRSNPRLYENFDLFVNANQCDGQIILECQYNTGLFDGDTVRRWLASYREALSRAIADPGLSMALALAPTDADQALLDRFNESALDYRRDLSVHELIERQAAATPEAIAAVVGDKRLSYRELEQRANGVAHELIGLGIKSGDLVGLACGRNEHMLVGLLGILKAGAGYVPMDPAFPAERLEYMLSQSEARMVVCDSSVAATLQLGVVECLIVDQLGKRDRVASPPHGFDDVAYVIYTSGSTGKPKGVRVPHRAVANLLASMAREPGMTASNTVLAVTTLSFDIAVAETLLPLSVGATVVVADREQAMDGEQLRTLIETQGVDLIQATPSTWRLLLGAGWQGGAEIKALCGGEPLPPDLAQSLLQCAGELWNCYGPTETTVWSSFYRVYTGQGAVPIGRPAANTQLHIVDAKLRPLPVGVVGEIFIGGEGVTLGYHNRPDLTAERFLPDPNRPGHTWYKTGDLGRWRADGVMECLGRTDHQVKVRGYRIELGEIEATLAQHPDVDGCVVITREDEPGDVRLVAYAVSRGPAIESNAVRDWLRSSLPPYMIPSFVMGLPSIPLLPNGKINRAKLPRPELPAPGSGEHKRPPSTPLEAQVLRAMEDVLKLPGLGVTDDFFAIGGHSLLAAKLTSRLNKELGLTLPLRSIFEAPTTEGLARAIEKALSAGGPQRAKLVRQADQSCGPLTLMQDRIRFLEEMRPGRVVYNTPSGHRLTGPLDREAFAAAIRMLVDRNPALRTFIDTVDGHAVQRVLPSVDFDLPFEDLSEVPADQREAELMKRLYAVIDRPIDIHKAPLFRVGLWRLGEEEHVFLFMPHHIIWDGWSFDLLYQEMALLYPAALGGSKASQPPPAASYIDFAAWQQDWLASEECQAQLGFWRQRFQSFGAGAPLPTDHPRRAGMSGEGEFQWLHIDKTLTERLRKVAQDNGATLNMLAMAIYVAMIGQATESRSTVIGIPVRGRLLADIESVMGFFNNLLPVHFRLQPELDLPSWLVQVKAELLDAFAHQDVPFELLAAEPEIAKYTGHLYQSLFSFQDARERLRKWGPLSHSSVLVMQKGATEDFALWLMEVPGGLEGGSIYNVGLFNASTARLFHDRLIGLLARVADRPTATLEELLAAPGEDTDAFVGWINGRRASAELEERPEGKVEVIDARPLTSEQQRLAEIWADLIGIDTSDIMPEDNFFDLGGNSMLAIKAVLLSERDLGIKIEPSRMVRENLGQLAATPVTVATAETSEASKTDAPSDAVTEPTHRKTSGPMSSLLRRFGSG